jgi:hypothetical protein
LVPKPGTAALAVFAVLVMAGALAAEQFAGAVRYAKDRLTVHAQSMPLTDIVSEIARQSGAAIVGEVRGPREVSEDFEDVPLANGLERLLGEQSFTLRYTREGNLRTIKLLGEALALATPSTAADAASEPQARSSPAPRRGGGVVPAHEPASDRGAGVTVRSAPGGESKLRRKRKEQREDSDDVPKVPFGVTPQDSAISQGQPGTNDQSLPGDDMERKVRRGVLNTLDQMDDAALAAYLGTPEGKHVAALLQYYAAHHPSSTANQKANGILDRVPSQPSPPPPARR